MNGGYKINLKQLQINTTHIHNIFFYEFVRNMKWNFNRLLFPDFQTFRLFRTELLKHNGIPTFSMNLCVCVNKDFERFHVFLCIKQMVGRHKADNILAEYEEVLADYKIPCRLVGYLSVRILNVHFLNIITLLPPDPYGENRWRE